MWILVRQVAFDNLLFSRQVIKCDNSTTLAVRVDCLLLHAFSSTGTQIVLAAYLLPVVFEYTRTEGGLLIEIVFNTRCTFFKVSCSFIRTV